MSVTTVRTRALVALLVLSALVLVWAGGFVLSSQNSRCTEGPGARGCTGTFSSGAWHGVGLAAVAAGLAAFVAAAVTIRGRLWLADPRLGDHNPPPGWDENQTMGSLVTTGPRRAVFYGDGGRRAFFRRATAGTKDPNAECE